MKAISNDNINECLVLPDWLYYEREDELLVHAALKHNNVARIKETLSRFHNLYDTISSARFNLHAAFNKKVVDDLTTEEDDGLWIQIQFLNNAIQWYNNSFDILLQSLWIYYGIYRTDCKTKKELKMPNDTEVALTTETLSVILCMCNYNKVNKWLSAKDSPLSDGLDKLHNTLSVIHKWANTFKHRGNISFLDNSIVEPVVTIRSLEDDNKVWYDSSYTNDSITINQCVSELVHYHKAIVEFSKRVTEEFKLFFRIEQ